MYSKCAFGQSRMRSLIMSQNDWFDKFSGNIAAIPYHYLYLSIIIIHYPPLLPQKLAATLLAKHHGLLVSISTHYAFVTDNAHDN